MNGAESLLRTLVGAGVEVLPNSLIEGAMVGAGAAATVFVSPAGIVPRSQVINPPTSEQKPEPPEISRSCETPPATTRTREPMPVRFEMVPSRSIWSQ